MKSQYRIDEEKAQQAWDALPVGGRITTAIARAKYKIVHRGPCRRKWKEQNPKPEVIKVGSDCISTK